MKFRVIAGLAGQRDEVRRETSAGAILRRNLPLELAAGIAKETTIPQSAPCPLDRNAKITRRSRRYGIYSPKFLIIILANPVFRYPSDMRYLLNPRKIQQSNIKLLKY